MKYRFETMSHLLDYRKHDKYEGWNPCTNAPPTVGIRIIVISYGVSGRLNA